MAKKGLLSAFFLLTFSAASNAALTTYTDFATWNAAVSGIETDSFDDRTHGGALPSPITRNLGAGSYRATEAGGTNLYSGADPDGFLTNANSSLTIQLDNYVMLPSSAMGLFVFGSDIDGHPQAGGPFFVQATDSDGAADVTVNAPDRNITGFVGFISTTSISSVTVAQIDPGIIWPSLDNLMFATAGEPTPTAGNSVGGPILGPVGLGLMSFLLGVLGLGASRRKR